MKIQQVHLINNLKSKSYVKEKVVIYKLITPNGDVLRLEDQIIETEWNKEQE